MSMFKTQNSIGGYSPVQALVDSAGRLILSPGSIGGGSGGGETIVRPASDALFGLAAGESHIGTVTGLNTVVSATFARPADAVAYSALDTISNSTSAPAVLSFANAARINAGSAYVVKARLVTDQVGCTARFKLHLFNTAPTAIGDNTPYVYLFANRANSVGSVSFDAAGTEGAGSDAAGSTQKTERLLVTCGAGTTTLYGVLETLDAFTPNSGQNFYVELSMEQN